MLTVSGRDGSPRSAMALAARAFVLAGVPWDDALVVSAHEFRRAVNACRAHPKVAVLTAPGAGPAELGRALFPQTPRSFIVCEDVDGAGERVVHVRPAEATTRPWNKPDVVLVLDNRRAEEASTWISGPALRGPTWALPQDAFGGESALSPEARSFVLAKLGPRIGDMVWDIGSGDGSIAIECARFGAAAVALDRDDSVCARIRENVRRHGVRVAVSRGEIRTVVDHLPTPDAVFLAGATPEALGVCASLARHRLVATASEDGIRALLDVLGDGGFRAHATSLQVTPLPEPPEPPSPVTIIWAERPAAVPEPPPAKRIRGVETLPPPPGHPVL
ncbi:methyltransferase domain-containing protein [Actinomadura opuntiae]|uniref:methyltransferase domain-containing protein n=1 Tax=Actinomadura sp. OS1-43 TaxID=604315 RepID=UPI00255B1DB1|nr:methyltransferase domain-containing protein [Actinomadura sp. OS1-43]MDL4819424.1 cobalamin biosynthesis bifunctional protein CbiET [Actinomadura sp. OS1-43]